MSYSIQHAHVHDVGGSVIINRFSTHYYNQIITCISYQPRPNVTETDLETEGLLRRGLDHVTQIQARLSVQAY